MAGLGRSGRRTGREVFFFKQCGSVVVVVVVLVPVLEQLTLRSRQMFNVSTEQVRQRPCQMGISGGRWDPASRDWEFARRSWSGQRAERDGESERLEMAGPDT